MRPICINGGENLSFRSVRNLFDACVDVDDLVLILQVATVSGRIYWKGLVSPREAQGEPWLFGAWNQSATSVAYVLRRQTR